MNGQRRATAWCGRLLLFSALLLGIVTMHTLGHPTGVGHEPCPVRGAGNCATSHDAPAAAEQHAQADEWAHSTTHSSPHGQNTGMDPMSVCLAVLGAGLLTIVLLLVTAALHRPGIALGTLRARLLRALRPIPPPPRHKALAQLSVLRV
ncbi:DUF6153 family protein [Streptomyces sp. UNOC14_S4]|uniref:DUF6153 family protein n=1 Tax=Streptomyces sp. UNOC14_S4 TaxID=2872340 RepID=UPI001E550ECA|nr:DUF6153 family protein [Streptomyces sp. UNOC14_S4]MCC3768616.1 hypothetical protein [Streptomyces sp. UNOC14_S4]